MIRFAAAAALFAAIATAALAQPQTQPQTPPQAPAPEAAAQPPGDFGVCTACHETKAGAGPSLGPKLFGIGGRKLNAHMNTRQLRRFCATDVEGKKLLRTAIEELGLSARAHDRILRMARTIADLEGAEDVQASHLSEAIGYRSLDRKLWAR